jgi:hypothetical protein
MWTKITFFLNECPPFPPGSRENYGPRRKVQKLAEEKALRKTVFKVMASRLSRP